MNPTLAALEDAITHQAREAAIADVNALFRRLEQDLYHLGIDLRRDEIRTKLKTDLDPLQRKILEAVTKEKACLLAERILRANAIIEKEAEQQQALEAQDDAEDVIIEEDIPDDCD